MQLKDVTRIFGRLGLLLPLTLIFLMAADSAFACPGHTSKALYRTKAIKTRTVSHMPTTVISYRAPASYRRCGSNLFDTRGAKYVAVRGNGARYVAIRGSGAKYVAVRNDDGFSLGRKRYGAVYDVDYGVAARRYVTVNRDPVYVANGTRYVPVRLHTPQTRYVAVRRIDIDEDDDVRYVAVRRVVPRTRYIAVRNIDIDDDDAPRYVAVRSNAPRTKYAAVRNIDIGCTRAVALRSCLDQIETTRVKHVVLRDDDDDSDYSKLVALRDESDDDKYIAVASNTPKYVEYRDAGYIAANDFGDTCLRNVAVRTCRPDAVSTRTITYEVPDLDDQAFLHDDDAQYMAADNMEDACLPRRVVDTSPAVVTTRAVSYVPAEYVDEDASLMVSEPTYVLNQTTVSQPRWVALDDDRVFDDLDPTWVDEVEGLGAGTVSYVPGGDVLVGNQAVSYVPVDDVDVETVSYVPVDDLDVDTVSYVPVDDVDVDTVSYVPVDDMRLKTVSYVPVDNVDTTYIADDACPMLVSNVDAEPIYISDASTVLVEEVDADLVAGLQGTQQIAGRFGFRDGFEDGQEAALEGDLYHPENSGDYKKATEGYEDEFGDKDVYKDSYRSSYLAGYRAGFQSGSSV